MLGQRNVREVLQHRARNISGFLTLFLTFLVSAAFYSFTAPDLDTSGASTSVIDDNSNSRDLLAIKPTERQTGPGWVFMKLPWYINQTHGTSTRNIYANFVIQAGGWPYQVIAHADTKVNRQNVPVYVLEDPVTWNDKRLQRDREFVDGMNAKKPSLRRWLSQHFKKDLEEKRLFFLYDASTTSPRPVGYFAFQNPLDAMTYRNALIDAKSNGPVRGEAARR